MSATRRLLIFLCLVGLFCIALWSAGGADLFGVSGKQPTPTPDPSETEISKTEEQEAAGEVITDLGADLSTAGESALVVVEELFEKTARRLLEDDQRAQEWSQVVGHTLRLKVFGFTLGQLALSFFILLLTLSLRRLLTQILFRQLSRLLQHWHAEAQGKVLAAVQQPTSIFILLVGLFFTFSVLPMEPGVRAFLNFWFRAGVLIILVWIAVRMTDLAAAWLENNTTVRKDSALLGFFPLIKRTLKVFVLVIGVLMTIDNLGYNVTGIIATLGLGTAAVALASQDTLRNGFGALMIMLDRPFKVGDWIQVGDKVDGDVESIGLRSTRVRTWPKTVISIPNGVLANEYIDNWSRMPKRRVRQTVGVTYDATADDMEAIVEDIRQLLREDEGVNQEYILVSFTDFGDSSLDIFIYYFTNSTVWAEYMAVRQRVNCKIMRAIKARGLSVAFPTRTVHLLQEGAGNARPPAPLGPELPQ